jgi:hypothetical protein
MADLSELLKQYGETCTTLETCERAIKCGISSLAIQAAAETIAGRKVNLEAQITSLFASATEAGARIERDKIPEWRDIETAPKDGRDVLLWPCGIFGEPSPDIGYWDRDPEEECGQCWRTLDGERIEPLPTHWQKVPDPPEIESCETAAIRERSEGGTQ